MLKLISFGEVYANETTDSLIDVWFADVVGDKSFVVKVTFFYD